MNNKTTLSTYTYKIAQGVQLGDEYLRLSIEALREDDEEIELRKRKICLIDKLKGEEEMKIKII